jgi:hypothetical protein
MVAVEEWYCKIETEERRYLLAPGARACAIASPAHADVAAVIALVVIGSSRSHPLYTSRTGRRFANATTTTSLEAETAAGAADDN